ncbi:MAG: hydantoinase/oxoprolinase family protein, partial [Desulfobacterales bacterium]|nr:hydantoinase/oxoprolinase family protein [Desulfobacterales bacterium]
MKTHQTFDPGAGRRGLRAAKEKKETNYVVGIDTGGTYTDGVLMDYHTREVLASGKTLTTREDLARGVVSVLKSLNIKDPARVKLVGISSTLATNSVAEGKARDVGLILIGYDRELVMSFGLEEKLSTPYFEFFAGGHTSQGEAQAPLDIEGIKAWVAENRDKVDAFAISSYFSPLNPSHEEAVFRAVQDICEHPVVLGHQLSTQLDSVKRAATASLNASLVAVMHEFIEAVKSSLKTRKIQAPLMIVKGDGSLMPYTEAVEKPVETILSGPAASAIGGLFFSGHSNALMVDVGGTTTDLAFIQEGQVSVSDTGARVGEIETAVKAARIRTACVGCDSRISFGQGGRVQVGPDRVVPLSRLAAKYPNVRESVLSLNLREKNFWKPSDIEFWMLHKQVDPQELGITDAKHIQLLNLLNKGPASLTEILNQLGLHHSVQLKAADLFRQGLIEPATLTPTDLLHISGQMDTWDAEVARQAVTCACGINDRNPKTFVDQTLDQIIAMMVEEAVVFLAGQQEGTRLPDAVDGQWGRWLLDESIRGSHGHLAVNISSRFPVIGIGAPAGIFVKRVAETLKAPFVLPEHAHVANAAGAVAGSVVAEKEAILYTQETGDSHAYVVQIGEERTSFTEYEEAVAHARKKVRKMATRSAESAGAKEPQVKIRVKTEGDLERIRARAVGNPRLSAQFG